MVAAIPEPIPERSDVTKALRTSYNLRAAHMGIMLDKMQRQIRRAERYEQFAVTGDPQTLNAPSREEEEMGVNIGNEYHYHYQTTAPEAASTQVNEETEEEAATEEEDTADEEEEPPSQTSQTIINAATNGLTKYIAPTLIGAALLGAGGVGMGLYNYFTDRPESVTTITRPGSSFEYRYDIKYRDTE